MKHKPSAIKQILAAPPPKILRDDTPLCHVFDLLWDAKQGSDLKRFGLTDNKEVHQRLAEAGFDVQQYKKDIEEWKRQNATTDVQSS